MRNYLLLTGLILVFHCAYSQCDPSNDFTATSNQNYIVKEWTLNDIVVLDNTANNYFIIADTAIHVTVEFLYHHIIF
jgi:hypothetical protein